MPHPPSVVKLAHVLEAILASMSRKEKAALARARLSPSQARVLSAIGSGRLTRMSELTGNLRMSKSTVSSSLDALEQLSLLVRSRHSGDRRVYPIQLTDRGRSLARRIQQDQEGALIRAAAELTPYQRKTLASALDALLEALVRTEKEHRE